MEQLKQMITSILNVATPSKFYSRLQTQFDYNLDSTSPKKKNLDSTFLLVLIFGNRYLKGQREENLCYFQGDRQQFFIIVFIS